MANPDHYIAVIGGAVSGAEAAHQLTQKGIKVAVFEQNNLPYGKIEDGLPKWHVRLRDKEEDRINRKLNHEMIEYLPGIKLGRDVGFQELAKDWGFSAVLLATGAWRDRPLPVKDIDDYKEKGFAYQNSFIYWFNHKHESDYSGPKYEITDNAIIVGGGLASLDVAKVFMFEMVQKALEERGHKVSIFDLDRSIAKKLDELGLTLKDLGINGCTIFYRRRIKDMPLSPINTDSPEMLTKAEGIREKIFNHYQSKYLFHVKPLHIPVDKVVENGKVTGMVFQKSEVVDGRVRAIPGSETTYKSKMVISSIGSLPEQINGIPLDGQIYKIIKKDCCRIEGFDNVFALGNAVTGRGNIIESLKHGREVSQAVIEAYFEDLDEMRVNPLRDTEKAIDTQIDAITQKIASDPILSPEQVEALETRIKNCQAKSGYDGDYPAWIKKHMPSRLETQLGINH
ncbi:FAD-dependent oxidoreductase [bacterium]|nr:FAD-dependent oxidoreductase [bacterium]